MSSLFTTRALLLPDGVVCIDRRIGAQALPSLRRAAAPVKKVVAPQTTVLRVVVGREFVKQQKYTELRANPTRFLKTRFPTVKDAWGFAEEDRCGDKAIVGLVRVAATQADTFLKDSGRNALFFEPTAVDRHPVAIEWHSKAEEETAQEEVLGSCGGQTSAWHSGQAGLQQGRQSLETAGHANALVGRLRR